MEGKQSFFFLGFPSAGARPAGTRWRTSRLPLPSSSTTAIACRSPSCPRRRSREYCSPPHAPPSSQPPRSTEQTAERRHGAESRVTQGKEQRGGSTEERGERREERALAARRLGGCEMKGTARHCGVVCAAGGCGVGSAVTSRRGANWTRLPTPSLDSTSHVVPKAVTTLIGSSPHTRTISSSKCARLPLSSILAICSSAVA
eukprot:1403031-Rhodomonas_salina.2